MPKAEENGTPNVDKKPPEVSERQRGEKRAVR